MKKQTWCAAVLSLLLALPGGGGNGADRYAGRRTDGLCCNGDGGENACFTPADGR